MPNLPDDMTIGEALGYAAAILIACALAGTIGFFAGEILFSLDQPPAE